MEDKPPKSWKSADEEAIYQNPQAGSRIDRSMVWVLSECGWCVSKVDVKVV